MTAVVGVVAAAVGALLTNWPTATAYVVDTFGRVEPVLESTTISGTFATATAPALPPTHDVPEPPTVGGSIPGDPGGGSGRPPSPWLTSLDCLAHHGTWDGTACAGGDPAPSVATDAVARDAAFGVWDPVTGTCGPQGPDVAPPCPAGTTWDGTRCAGPAGDRLTLPAGHPAGPPPAAPASPFPLLAALVAALTYL